MLRGTNGTCLSYPVAVLFHFDWCRESGGMNQGFRRTLNAFYR